MKRQCTKCGGTFYPHECHHVREPLEEYFGGSEDACFVFYSKIKGENRQCSHKITHQELQDGAKLEQFLMRAREIVRDA